MKQAWPGERQTSRQAGGGTGAALPYRRHTRTSPAGSSSGCQKPPFCPQLMQVGNRQQQKGGLIVNSVFPGCARREYPCGVCAYRRCTIIFLKLREAVFLWDGAAPLIAWGLVEADAARSDLLWAGRLRASWDLSASYKRDKTFILF